MQSFTVYNYSILYIIVYYLSFRQLGIVNQYKKMLINHHVIALLQIVSILLIG
mgnify:CR=1 FL=1